MRKLDGMAVLLFAFASGANAMHLSQRGLGQVMIAPYYTVNAGYQTQLSIANRSEQGKALKVRFLEGMNGREVFGFNLYLAPHDLWTGALFSRTDDGAAILLTRDESCTVPALKNSTTLPQLPNGWRIAPFNTSDFTGARYDAGPEDLLRTREGYFEIIEMGEVINAAQRSLNDITPGFDGIPSNCPRIEAAWNANGYWVTNPEIDLLPPGGALTTTVTLVNALEGTLFSYQAEAIDGFSAIVLHTAPNDARPNLSSGNTLLGQGMVEAVVDVGGTFIRSQYPLNRAIDAVSALFMAETVNNEFVTSAGVGGASTWVVTLPTKKFYTDDALVTNAAVAPFNKRFAESYRADQGISIHPPPLPQVSPFQEARGEAIYVDIRNRENVAHVDVCVVNPTACIPIGPPVSTTFGVPSIHWASNLIAFNSPSCSGFFSSMGSAERAVSRLCQKVEASFLGVRDGWMSLRLYDENGADSLPRHLLRADAAGRRYAGLPAIGFWAVSYTNGQLQPGVLSNYASLRRHSANKRIVLTTP